MRRKSSGIQLELRHAGWGGKRPGAGRKPRAGSGIPHLRLTGLASRFPCHVTLKVRDGVPSLRTVKLVRELERSWAKACDRGDFRLAHYSIQANHVHLLVEARDADALGRGMKSLGGRLARVVNRVFARSGPVLKDRYHHVVLKSPTQVRNALRYVLMNARRHMKRPPSSVRIDPASSGRWFGGWKRSARDLVIAARGRPGTRAVAFTHTWLLNEGWKRAGPLLDPAAAPG